MSFSFFSPESHQDPGAPISRRLRKGLVWGSAVLLAFSLSSCAPEPSGHDGKGAEVTDPETKWNDSDTPPLDAETELPDSFPTEYFAVPDGATIENTGSGEAGSWFLVLKAANDAEADALWDEVIDSNAFSVSDETETSEGGRLASLRNDGLTVDALTIPQSDGSVQLSYDLALS